jgi:predicted  nucleic acid-binding Zn-ribbon protein
MSLQAELREAVDDLDSRIEALLADAKPIRDQIANIDRSLSKLRTERTEKVAKLAEMKEKPRVSDHAVIRYLEREYGFTFEDIREKLLTPFVLAAMDAGAEAVQLNGGTLKLKGRTVVTYVD